MRVAILVLQASLRLTGDLAPFTFQVPEGWVSLSGEQAPFDLASLSPAVRHELQTGQYALFAVHRGPGGQLMATVNVRMGDAPVHVTSVGWDQFIEGVPERLARDAIELRPVEQGLSTIEGVNVGRLVADVRSGNVQTRQLQYYIPSRTRAALVTYSSPPDLFDAYLPIFEAAARATRGAQEPSVLARLAAGLRLDNPQDRDYALGFAVGWLAIAVLIAGVVRVVLRRA